MNAASDQLAGLLPDAERSALEDHAPVRATRYELVGDGHWPVRAS
ncbi:hypothetical protein ABZ814_29235 [Micromonospora musae]